MHIKNLALWLLALTNILCLFIIVDTKQTGFGQIKAMISSTAIPSDKQMLQISKEELIKDYNPTGKICGAAVSLSKRGSFSGTPRLDMVCLIQGSRTVIWETLQDVKNELMSEYHTFEQLAEAENIQELDGLSYRPEGKRNALLFIKQRLLFEHNDFLQGYLLGYDEKDIEFFYQRWQFMKKNEDAPLIPGSYTDFSADLKKEFENFKKYEWPLSKDHSRHELDKKKALDWLDENKAFNNDQLNQQIQELKKNKAP